MFQYFRYNICLSFNMNNFLYLYFLIIPLGISSQNKDLINTSNNIGLENWRIVNDDVMGGISTSELYLNNDKNLIFNGNLSLENNGGFASSRMGFEKGILKEVKSFKIKVKGDGKTYKFRLRENYRSTNYSSDFKTLKNKWIEIEIKTNQLKPMFMGYYSNRSPKLNTEKISSLGFQISDKQKGNFNLEIMYVKAIY